MKAVDAEEKATAVRYRIDPGRSRFVVRAFATGLLSALGHSPTIAVHDFTGEVRFDPGSPEQALLKMRVSAGSLSVADDVSDKDRREMERQMREEVLQTDRYNEIVFESSKVVVNKVFDGQYNAKIAGSLSLRGVTRNCGIDAQVIVNADTLRARGEFPLRQSDFGIKPVSAAGGTIKLKDELKCSFEIVAELE